MHYFNSCMQGARGHGGSSAQVLSGRNPPLCPPTPSLLGLAVLQGYPPAGTGLPELDPGRSWLFKRWVAGPGRGSTG